MASTRGLREAHATAAPTVPRAYSCRCGRPVFFRNSECLACGTPLGYEPFEARLVPLQEAKADQPAGTQALDGRWREAAADGVDAPSDRLYHRCANLQTGAACNWLIVQSPAAASGPALAPPVTPALAPTDAPPHRSPLCICCELTRTLPPLGEGDNTLWWNRIEMAKRRLVSSLIGLGLPVRSRLQDPVLGLAFDLLRAAPGEPRVVTGHADGVITLDVEEADDAHREQRRADLREPYRTLLGHLRHECGHYYWQLLVEPGPWLQPFRSLFGDERQDYAQSLRRHYEQGAAADWNEHFVSAYASCHPWEDWAETFAHYLHLRDTLDTARSFGLDGERVELSYERFGPEVLGETGSPQDFLHLINNWMELTGVLNELSRSMGVHDFYPFVLSAPVVRKLHLVHQVVCGARG